jgi:ABC-type lipoprotein export system ATPase subunit
VGCGTPAAAAAAYDGRMGGPVATLRDVHKAYGSGGARRVLLAAVDLELRAGEMVAVVGRSGTGKSTLLHVLGGLEPVDSGTVEVGGVRLDRSSASELVDVRRRLVGFVFQFFHLLPELTGFENVLLPARLAGDGVEAAERAAELMRRLGVEDAGTRLPGVLSGGEQQRLAVARALVNRPQLLLADEPTGNLDEASGHEVLQLLRAVADGFRSVLLVTHDREAARLADRVLTLRDGRLVE